MNHFDVFLPQQISWTILIPVDQFDTGSYAGRSVGLMLVTVQISWTDVLFSDGSGLYLDKSVRPMFLPP